MSNGVPTFLVPRYKGGGNVQVFPLLAGMTLDAQDGGDVLAGPAGLETAGATRNVHGNRICHAFGKTFLIHGLRIYERDQTGVGAWGGVKIDQDPISNEHTGLHLLYPAGTKTLACMVRVAGNLLIQKTVDGVNWTEDATGFALAAPDDIGQSFVYRDSIFWYYNIDGGIGIVSHDLNLGATASYVMTTDGVGGNFLTHRNQLFFIGRNSASVRCSLWRLDGVSWTVVITPYAGITSVEGSPMIYSEGFDILMWFDDSVVSPRIYRVYDMLSGGSPTTLDLSASTNTAPAQILALTRPVGFYPFLPINPDPQRDERWLQRFWTRSGDSDTGTFDLYYMLLFRRMTPISAPTGVFVLGEIILGLTSGATGRMVRDILPSFMDLSDVGETQFVASEVVQGQTSGATMTLNVINVGWNPLAIQTVFTGAGISAVNFGLPVSPNGGGNERIATFGGARPEWGPTPPFEIAGGFRRREFRVYGLGAAVDIKLYHNPDSSSPDEEGTIQAVGRSSGASPVPTLSGNSIIGVTPDDGATVYYVDHDSGADGYTAGNRLTALLSVVVP